MKHSAIRLKKNICARTNNFLPKNRKDLEFLLCASELVYSLDASRKILEKMSSLVSKHMSCKCVINISANSSLQKVLPKNISSAVAGENITSGNTHHKSFSLAFRNKEYGTLDLYFSSSKKNLQEEESQTISEFAKRIAIVLDSEFLKQKAKESNKLHRKALFRLKESNEKMKNMIESTSDAFVSFDKNWRYTYLNHVAEKFEQRKKEQLIGKVIWEVFPNSVKTLFYKKYHEAMETGRPIEFEEFIKHDNKWYEIRAYPYHDGLSIYYRDITDKKLLDLRKDEFISMASHELKTPVTSIKIYSELLDQMHLGKKPKVYLNKISSQIIKMTKLISDLLDISKIQIGKLTFQKSDFSLSKLLKETVSVFKKSDRSRTISLKVNWQGNIFGDKDRISQVISNLIGNAYKYSPHGSKIDVEIFSDKKENVIISVKDYGIGINNEYLSKIFDRFYRSPGNDNTTYPGLGMGLYISKIIAENHGGRIEVKSEIGCGSTFSLVLPLSG